MVGLFAKFSLSTYHLSIIFETTQGGISLQMSLTSVPATVRAVFALQVVVTVLAFLVFLIVASLAALLFVRRRSRQASRKTSPKGTLAFLSIGVLCLAIAQGATAASVALQTNSSSPASVTHAFSLHYQGSSSDSAGEASTTSVNLSFLNAFAFIISTVCLNGAVWLHSSHATANGLAVGQPSRLSIIGNTLLLLVMTATGLASWGLAMSSYTANERYGNVLQDDLLSRVVYTVFRACVVGSTISVAIEAIRRFVQVKNHSSRDVRGRPSSIQLDWIAANNNNSRLPSVPSFLDLHSSPCPCSSSAAFSSSWT
jgi:hypothetical protein